MRSRLRALVNDFSGMVCVPLRLSLPVVKECTGSSGTPIHRGDVLILNGFNNETLVLQGDYTSLLQLLSVSHPSEMEDKGRILNGMQCTVVDYDTNLVTNDDAT